MTVQLLNLVLLLLGIEHFFFKVNIKHNHNSLFHTKSVALHGGYR